MGKNPNKKTYNVYTAPNLLTKSLNLIGRLLVFIGKPFYKLISYLFVFLLFIGYIIGYFFKEVSNNFFDFLIRLISLIFIFAPLSLYNYVRNKIAIKKLFSKTKHKKKHVIDFSELKDAYINKLYSLRKAIRSIFAKLIRAVWLTIKLTFKTTHFFSKISILSIKGVFLFSKNIVGRLTKFIQLFLKSFKLPKPALSMPKIPISKKSLFLTLISSFLVLFIAGVTFAHTLIFEDLPSPKRLTTRDIEVSTKIYDRNGILLYTIYDDKNRTPISLGEVPESVRLATLAIEDAEFYSHPGFSIRGIIRAIFRNIERGDLSGGSTITQQLVKNALLSPEKTFIRKAREAVLAFQVEQAFQKDEILEMYLNEVSYGGTAYGIQEASQLYFDKSVDNLTLPEAALLAGLPKSPTQYSPFGTNPQLSLVRQKEVLRLMEVNGFISHEERVKAEEEVLTFSQNKIDIKAPHFVMYVRDELERKYSKEVVEKGGLKIVTTLDLRIQELAEKIVREEIAKLAPLNVTNGAVVILNPQTGEILAMVGSKNYFDTQSDGNVNVATSLRQPGSSIKVINYAYALSNDLNAATIIQDSPVTFQVDGQPPYTPRNYEGSFRGNLTLRSAFAQSRNIPAVRVLASYGVNNMIKLGKKMGITTWENPDNYGLSLTLGGGEIKLIDLAQAYATIANYGKRPDLVSTLEITNYKGRVLDKSTCADPSHTLAEKVPGEGSAYTNMNLISSAQASESAQLITNKSSTCQQEEVVDPRVAFLITDILKDNAARAPSFGTNSMLVIPEHSEVAVKTGTSNNLRDNLTIGYNQNYLVAVWVGNNDNSEMSRVASGITGASPIFNKIMRALLAGSENHDWEIPEGMVQLPICPYTGTLACSGCPVKMEWFLEENKPEIACRPEWFSENNDQKEENQKADDPTGEIQIPVEKVNLLNTRGNSDKENKQENGVKKNNRFPFSN